MTSPQSSRITVGELVARFLESCGVQAAFGVISIHNMPMLDAFHRRGKIRFVSARGEAGACNMADACARVSQTLGVCVTSTGTGAGNAVGALIEAMTAGTPMLHLTGQIDTEFIDRDLGFIHESPTQLALLQESGKAAFRIRNAETALATLREAVRIAWTPPCGPVSIEIPIDVQATLMDLPTDLSPVAVAPVTPSAQAVDALARRLQGARRPLLWVGGGARGAQAAVQRFVDMGWGIVTSVQGRGVVAEDHPSSLGSHHLHKPVEELYQQCDAMLVVGSRLRSNETLRYHLKLPTALYRIDANALAHNRGYTSEFVHGDASLTLHALADQLEGRMQIDPSLAADLQRAKREAMGFVTGTLGPYSALKDALSAVAAQPISWVRDITLFNTMWGNRGPSLDISTAGVHAVGGGIGQGLAMGIGAAMADAVHGLARKTVTLVGDGGFMLNVGELACAAQERANMLIVLMNDSRYGVIRNIQDDIYGGRHCYVDLHTPDFAQFCQSLRVPHMRVTEPAVAARTLGQAMAIEGPVVVEIDMTAWGSFGAKFAGPIVKKD